MRNASSPRASVSEGGTVAVAVDEVPVEIDAGSGADVAVLDAVVLAGLSLSLSLDWSLGWSLSLDFGLGLGLGLSYSCNLGFIFVLSLVGLEIKSFGLG